MKIFKRFTMFEPDNGIPGALYLRDDGGQCWYDCQLQFNSKTIKICFDENNIIRSVTNAESGHDASGLWPINMSVAEIEDTEDARRIKINGQWQFIDGIVSERELTDEEMIAQAVNLKNDLLAQAAIKIAPLQDAVDLNIATEEEAGKLAALKLYRVELMRVNTSTAPDISWPIMQE